MKYYTFKRESNKFDDILTDPSLKKLIYTKITWSQHLLIGLDEFSTKEFDKLASYIVLKYGDDICTQITKDYAPIPNVDYIPIRK